MPQSQFHPRQKKSASSNSIQDRDLVLVSFHFILCLPSQCRIVARCLAHSITVHFVVFMVILSIR